MHIKELQNELLKILVAFKEFCDENNLKYHLAYGTLLGAVRHKGFIPWDDDIDVIMPLDDYNKLLALFDNRLYLQSINNDKTYFYLFAKLKFYNNNDYATEEDKVYRRKNNGPWIDIFPCIKIPGIDTFSFKVWEKSRRLISSVLALKAIPYRNASFSKKLFKPFVSIVPRFFLVLFINKSSLWIQNKKTYCYYVQDFWSPPWQLVLMDYDFDNTTILPFDGFMFKAPYNFDKVLKDYYGNYMVLPPEEKRHGHFKF